MAIAVSIRAALRGLVLVVLPGIATGAVLALLLFDGAPMLLREGLPKLLAPLDGTLEALHVLVARLVLARGGALVQAPLLAVLAGTFLVLAVISLAYLRRRRRSADLVERLHRLYG